MRWFCNMACANIAIKAAQTKITMSSIGMRSVQAAITLIRLGKVAACNSTTAVICSALELTCGK